MISSRYNITEWLSRYWIPGGLVLFLWGIFWAPSAHILAVWTPYALLLPALLALMLVPQSLPGIKQYPAFWLSALYLGYMTLNTFVLQGEAGVEYVKWSFYILLFLIALDRAGTLNEKRFGAILVLVAGTGLLAGAYAIFRDMHSGTFWTPKYRLKGYVNLYNELRSGFMFGTCALFAFWYSKEISIPGARRIISATIALLCILITLLTDSRAPLMALVVAISWSFMLEKRWLYSGVFLAISTGVMRLFWEKLSSRGTSLRPEIWRYVWEQCLAHPWFGIGLTNIPIAVPTTEGIKYNAHNVPLTVLYQGGLMGLVFFGATIAATFYQGWRVRHLSAAAVLALMLHIYALICIQFEGLDLCTRPADVWVILWLPTAVSMYAVRRAYASNR
ncbi:MAG TPA: O-antigen ligase family protein [Spongiibacteraceae bacterium]|nr:O-antigen ligase family protein [Spongiibacteraceae bacterium]